MKKKSQKVLKHVLSSPFTSNWPELSKEDSLSFVNILKNEAVSQAIFGVKLDSKILKTGSASLDVFLRENLIFGVAKSIEHIKKVSFVVLFRSDQNEILLEGLYLLCRNLGVTCLALDFEVVKEKLEEITGVKFLACLAFPLENTLPQTCNFLNGMKSRYVQKRLMPVRIKTQEIVKNVKGK
jgi:hypothetical protein